MENGYKMKLEKNVQTNEKLGIMRLLNDDILLLIEILYMVTYHPGHGSSMQSHKSF